MGDSLPDRVWRDRESDLRNREERTDYEKEKDKLFEEPSWDTPNLTDAEADRRAHKRDQDYRKYKRDEVLAMTEKELLREIVFQLRALNDKRWG